MTSSTSAPTGPAGPGPGAPHLPELRHVQRSRRQRLAAPRGHDTPSGPGMGGLTWTSPPWQSCCTKRPSVTARSRPSPTPRLVGLVRGVSGRAPERCKSRTGQILGLTVDSRMASTANSATAAVSEVEVPAPEVFAAAESNTADSVRSFYRIESGCLVPCEPNAPRSSPIPRRP